jgi:hypothetical protein|tara:strand:+ start:441 stop:587 length:147 start_codon:yes stop_codon:yes gene_type:complete
MNNGHYTQDELVNENNYHANDEEVHASMYSGQFSQKLAINTNNPNEYA